MIIKRNINGTEVEIELTQQEMYEAYEERQHYYDMQDIKDRFDDIGNAAEIAEVYGMPWTEIEPLIPEMAYLYRKYMDNYSDDWLYQMDEAIDEAIADVIDVNM